VAMSENLGAQLDPDFRLFEFAAPYLQQFWMERYSPKALVSRMGQTLIDAAELSLDLPQRASRLIGQLERGEVQFNINHEGLQDFAQQLQRMVNRLALSILLASIIMALGLLMIIYHPPGWDRLGGWVFGIAFLSALGFGAQLMWNIWRSSKS